MTTNVSEPAAKRAIELAVGDRIAPEFLPRLFGKEPAEVVFVRDHRLRRESFVFVAFAYPDGYHDSTSFVSGAELKVWPAQTAEPKCTPECDALYTKPASAE